MTEETSRQYLRRCNLFVTGLDGKGIDLSELRIKFDIKRSSTQSPNAAEIKVYNLAASTALRIQKEFSRVVLQAGYESNFGVIFDGSIVQVYTGRDSVVDHYVAIVASDGDLAYNFAVVNTTLAAGSTRADHIGAIQSSMAPLGTTLGPVDASQNQSRLPRSKSMFGMARDELRMCAMSDNANWSIQDGKLQYVPRSTFLPGRAVDINSKTGMINAPEQTTDGIKVRTLINPQLRVDGRIRLNNADVLLQSEFSNLTSESADTATTKEKPAELSADGIYRAISIDYIGDTRGTDWYADITCLDVDATAPSGEEVDPR